MEFIKDQNKIMGHCSIMHNASSHEKCDFSKKNLQDLCVICFTILHKWWGKKLKKNYCKLPIQFFIETDIQNILNSIPN